MRDFKQILTCVQVFLRRSHETEDPETPKGDPGEVPGLLLWTNEGGQGMHHHTLHLVAVSDGAATQARLKYQDKPSWTQFA